MQTTETKPLDRMKEAFNATFCPACGTPKRDRQDWFCKPCWYELPKKLRSALKYRPWAAFAEWMQAMAILKEKQAGQMTETTCPGK